MLIRIFVFYFDGSDYIPCWNGEQVEQLAQPEARRGIDACL